MTTTLEKPLRREIDVEGQPYTVVMDAQGLKITRKAHRRGIELKWAELINGDAAGLNGSADEDQG
ncbi:hypothetical protein [Dyella nitratireducens]|uniref:Uncharacterized protein n=1 Tax=Dyella nitratireducens TaxID=1849580 RepID=A0ABQ1GLU7_9GAMM|nr:hypothetical protein [Dyella nitratireducens]GGA46383.1 hypothetical protein GCM10010981_39400 [Dyella nitratireducens]GLQ41442.1 hypothetical protein GCM10007902_12920 [Dyella nitratireducens]